MVDQNRILPQSGAVVTRQDPRWSRIVARDSGADGTFWYSVSTTRIFCRPSCPSRTAYPEHVSIHDTMADAIATGHRACRRCNPTGLSQRDLNVETVAQACRIIEASEHSPTLAELAAAVELSPGYFHRIFKAAIGITPRAYASAHRAQRFRAGLGQSGTVTEAIYDAGFNSIGRFYEQSDHLLGMTPSAYRAGGADEEIRFAVAECSLGALLVASSRRGVASILLGDDPCPLLKELQDRFPRAHLLGADEAYERLVARVVEFAEAPGLGLALPREVRGTAFQQRVWQALRGVPTGTPAGYADVVASAGLGPVAPTAASAWAPRAATGTVPCHRVLRTDGSRSGYRWGIDRKHALLLREGGIG